MSMMTWVPGWVRCHLGAAAARITRSTGIGHDAGEGLTDVARPAAFLAALDPLEGAGGAHSH